MEKHVLLYHIIYSQITECSFYEFIETKVLECIILMNNDSIECGVSPVSSLSQIIAKCLKSTKIYAPDAAADDYHQKMKHRRRDNCMPMCIMHK